MAPDLANLIAALRSGDASDRREAAESLMTMGEDAAGAAAALAEAASDSDDEVREAAVGALEGLGTPPADRITPLADLLRESQPDTAYWAATLLGRLGPAAGAAVAQLTAALGPAAPLEVRQRAAWALAQIGPPARVAKRELEMATAHADPRLSRLAREALVAIGT
jgi:HEAT repeat protein